MATAPTKSTAMKKNSPTLSASAANKAQPKPTGVLASHQATQSLDVQPEQIIYGSLPTSLDQVRLELDQLHATLGVLADRLVPVCVPTESAECSSAVLSPNSAPINMTLANYSESIRYANHRIQVLLDLMVL